jgi:hypothetical protein
MYEDLIFYQFRLNMTAGEPKSLQALIVCSHSYSFFKKNSFLSRHQKSLTERSSEAAVTIGGNQGRNYLLWIPVRWMQEYIKLGLGEHGLPGAIYQIEVPEEPTMQAQ